MAGTTSHAGATIPGQSARGSQVRTGWVGWIVFAGVMMVMIGSLHFIEGLVAIFKDQYYVVGDKGLVVTVDYTAWGWVHMIGGALVVAAGVALFAGRTWARVVAVAVAALSILLNFGFTAAYPVWSILLIAMDVLVIYAVCVHGREMEA